MTELARIEQLAQAYEWQRRALYDLVAALERQVQDLKAVALPSIKAQVGAAAAARDELAAAIDAHRSLFVKPRTRTFHGIKLGLKKVKGVVEFDDEELVIKRIRKQLTAGQVELLIRVRESVDKNAVKDIETKDLKPLGITVTDDRDVVSIKPQDSEVAKLVDALLKGDDDVEESP